MNSDDLIEWRKRLGVSQEAASALLGCGKRSIQHWESGKNAIPKYIALACAAVALGIPEHPSKKAHM